MEVADHVGEWGCLVGQIYRIRRQLSVVLCVDIKEAKAAMLMMVEILES
jgi:hypothetical protein